MILYKSVSLADQVFDQLEADILSGRYARGTMLTEMKLCEELGVSRTPVREALKRLEQEHIIESSGKGMIVLGITDNDARVLFAIRESVEGLAAAACASNISGVQITGLNENLELQEFYLSKRDSEKIKELDSEFHRKIYEGSGSVVYSDTLLPLINKLQKVRKTSLENESRAEKSIEEHRTILDAISAHDERAAEAAMRSHVKNAWQYFSERADAED